LYEEIESRFHVRFNFGNVFDLLDVDGKGWVEERDWGNFIDQFTDSAVDVNIILQLQ
jgi:hypothetical protein